MKTISDTRFAEAAKPLSSINPPQFFKAHAENITLNTSGANAVRSTFASVYQKGEALANRRKAVDPTITEPANLLTVGNLTDDFVKSSNGELTIARNALNSSITEVEVKLEHAVGLKPLSTDAEIRAALLKLPSAKRNAAIREAFAKRDKAVISAVKVDSHPMLHGGDMEMIDTLFDKYQQEVAPNEYVAVRDHKKLLITLDQADPILLGFQRQAYTGLNRASELRRTEALLKSYIQEVKD